ncbi:MAG: CRISPR-associated helicase Cas3' [Bacillota bacterium]
MQDIYSHPDKLLKDHLFNVYHLGMKKFASKNLRFNNLDEIKLVTNVVLITHDFGKANKFFQQKLKLASSGQTDSQEYKKLTSQDTKKSNHSLLSALFTYYILEQLLDNSLLSLLGMSIVYRHHSNLKDFGDMVRISKQDWEILKEQSETIPLEILDEILSLTDLDISLDQFDISKLQDKLTNWRFDFELSTIKDKLTTEDYLIVNLIFSILISSDKAEAIFYNKNLSYERLEELVLDRQVIEPTVVDQYKQIQGWDQPDSRIDQQRNEIYDEVMTNIGEIDLTEDRILSINVPTGTGKTFASLAAGLRLRKRLGEQYRLIYTLPFTSIIDQNFKEFEKVFTETGREVDSSLLIKHHYLTPKSYTKTEDYEDEEYDISRHLIESWNSEIVVTTFVQLLHSIFSHRNRSLLKFHNLANSIILLDEVQSIPHKYWQLVRVMLSKLAEKLDCYFIFITATMPLIYSEEEAEIRELAVSKQEYFEFFDRIKLDLSEFREEKTIDEFKEFITDELKEYADQSCLIILNTIKTSIEVYEYIEELIEFGELKGDLVYLSTNIIPQEREKRIDDIGDGEPREIIVSTQMVEAGVDIDLDRVYRDFAPLDSINQSCGRCNRNFDPDKQGIVKLVKLVNENHNNKTYASYVYAKSLLRCTKKLLAKLDDVVEEKHFFEMNNNYFKQVAGVISDDKSVELLDKIKELKYKRAFSQDEEGKVFRLIEQDFQTVNLFIEVDDDAKEIWEKYCQINQLEINSPEDYSRRKAKFEQIKKEFLGYVITIPEEVAKEELEEEQLDKTFNLIDQNQISNDSYTVYDCKTGFNRDDSEVDTFF